MTTPASYRDFFTTLTGFPPFPWQERLQLKLQQGVSVILRVPTGAGKTWGAVAPYLYGLHTGSPIADRILYALPLRALASSLHDGVAQRLSVLQRPVKRTGKDRAYGDNAIYCSLQFGGQKDDPFFESDLVFTTIDQLLSNYIAIPVSLPSKLGNINGGALVGSFIVLDELHMLQPRIALATAIEMFNRLRGLCKFVLMTATLSDAAITRLAKLTGAEVLDITESEIRELPSQRTKQRTWHYSPAEISASEIFNSYKGGRSIVLVNSVSRAQNLFRELQVLFHGATRQTRLELLHSRYYPEHRTAIERRLNDYFGPNSADNDVILVTTQVIEAGMDLSAEQFHTELAPMSALIQRAGRSARFQHRNKASVTVYNSSRLGPYSDARQVVASTRQILSALPKAGSVIDFIEESSWIDKVHGSAESTQLDVFSLSIRREKVHSAMDQGDRGLLSSLVRDISSTSVLISSDPESN